MHLPIEFVKVRRDDDLQTPLINWIGTTAVTATLSLTATALSSRALEALGFDGAAATVIKLIPVAATGFSFAALSTSTASFVYVVVCGLNAHNYK